MNFQHLSTIAFLIRCLFIGGIAWWSFACSGDTIADGPQQTAEADSSVVVDIGTAVDADGFTSMFDGKSLAGWQKAKENEESWQVEDGMLVCHGPRCHLFYVGERTPMKDFHFITDVKTTPGSNSGIYFHTKVQDTGWPKYGFECQVNVSHKDTKKSSSLYAVVNVDDPGLKDDQWYTQEMIVKGKRVILKINGKVMVDYTEPDDQPAFSKDFERRLGEGTIALQAHDPHSKVSFRNLRVKSP